jgi:hypothetical protein
VAAGRGAVGTRSQKEVIASGSGVATQGRGSGGTPSEQEVIASGSRVSRAVLQVDRQAGKPKAVRRAPVRQDVAQVPTISQERQIETRGKSKAKKCREEVDIYSFQSSDGSDDEEEVRWRPRCNRGQTLKGIGQSGNENKGGEKKTGKKGRGQSGNKEGEKKTRDKTSQSQKKKMIRSAHGYEGTKSKRLAQMSTFFKVVSGRAHAHVNTRKRKYSATSDVKSLGPILEKSRRENKIMRT